MLQCKQHPISELASGSAPYYCHACISNALPINAVISTNDVKTDYLGLAEMKNEDIEVGCDYHDINSFNQLNTQNKNNICLLRVNSTLHHVVETKKNSRRGEKDIQFPVGVGLFHERDTSTYHDASNMQSSS